MLIEKGVLLDELFLGFPNLGKNFHFWEWIDDSKKNQKNITN